MTIFHEVTAIFNIVVAIVSWIN